MPIYTVPEAVEWLAQHGREIGVKGLSKAIDRCDIPHLRMGMVTIVSEDALQHFLENPPRRGRPRAGPQNS